MCEPRGGYKDGGGGLQRLSDLFEWAWDNHQGEAAALLPWARDAGGFRGGCIKDAAEFWEKVLLPQSGLPRARQAEMLSWIVDGVDVESFVVPFTGRFRGVEYVESGPFVYKEKNHAMTVEEKAFVAEEIASLLASGCVEVAVDPLMVMALGVEVNAVGKKRLIHDCQPLNCCTVWSGKPMKFDGLRDFQRGLSKGDVMGSLDHSKGYMHVALAEKSRRLMCFEFEGVTYSYRTLAFGWNIAPRVYGALTAVLAAYMRRKGVNTLVFLDDFGFSMAGEVGERGRNRLVYLVMGLQYLAGFVVNLGKSQLALSTRLLLLGFGLDSVLELFLVPDKKLQPILQLLREALGAEEMRLRKLQSLVGKLQSLVLAVPCVGTFLVAAFRAMSAAEAAGWAKVKVSVFMREDFEDLLLLESWSGLSRWPSERHARVRLEADASSAAWGGVLWSGGEVFTTGGAFEEGWAAKNIMQKEAAATVRTLRELGKHIEGGAVVDVYCDNRAVECTLLKGKLWFEEMRGYARELLAWQLQTGSIIRLLRVATEDNVVADRTSRGGWVTKDLGGDFSLSEEAFGRLCSWYEPAFTLDVCASEANARCKRYIVGPFEEQRGALAVNVFLHSFGDGEFLYCYGGYTYYPPI